jgi:hypothetical protein
VYGTQIVEEDYIRPLGSDGPLRDRADYRAHPGKYQSVFHSHVRVCVPALPPPPPPLPLGAG